VKNQIGRITVERRSSLQHWLTAALFLESVDITREV
jgi:hypothetical protein